MITMKQKRLFGSLICILVCFGAFLTYKIATRDPWDVAEKWYCEEIDMTIHFSMDENGNRLGQPSTQLTWRGKTHEVWVGFRSCYILFNENVPGTNVAKIVMCGEWKIRGRKMIITVGHDPANPNMIFGEELETLTFVPVK